MKVNNYLVTGGDLSTMGYIKKPGATPPLDGSVMNKGESDANYYIDQSASPWNTYTNDRCVKYQDYPCPCAGDVTIYNDLEGAIDQYVQYQDCSGNVKSIFVAAGQAVAIQGCVTQDPGGYTGCGVLRGSVYGINLNNIVYGTCCPGFTPCTTTSTTTVYIPSCAYNGLSIVCNTPSTAILDWSFTETATSGTMDIYVNGINVESRNATSNGTWTGLVVGDEIYVEIITGGCTGISGKANAYTDGIIVDAACDDSFVDLVTTIYTVQPIDIGTTLVLDCFALCSEGCV